MNNFLLTFFFVALTSSCSATYVSDADWLQYKASFNPAKTYGSTTAENNARYYFAVNREKIATHNKRYDSGLETYRLEVNQYSDLRFLEFAALFPATTDPIVTVQPPVLPANAVPPASFSYANIGITSAVQDQGKVCNSGWAYATATALQIQNAALNSDLNSALLSAQNIIDCAGGSKACTTQVPNTAFDFLTVYGQLVNPESVYRNTPLLGQGMCLNKNNLLSAVGLLTYAYIPNGNDETLKLAVNYVAPVVIKFNPGSFEFMHYQQGIFTQPTPTQTAAHFMTVVGYGTDALTARNYWLVQNSFGTTWGEQGFIRIERNLAKPIANGGLVPVI